MKYRRANIGLTRLSKMTYVLKNPKYYKKLANISKSLFNHIWPKFIHDSPNVENDEEVIDYLDLLAVEEVNDESSPFYLYG